MTTVTDRLACTIYVGGLPPSTPPATLAALFTPHVAHAVVVRTFGFVTFQQAAHAAEAAQRVDLCIDGRPVHAALSHQRYRPADKPAARPIGKKGAGSVFVKFLSNRRGQQASSVQEQLSAQLASHTTAPPRVHVPRKGGGGDQHRGYAFVECAGAADAAALLAALSQSEEWRAEMVRKKRSGGGGGGGKKGKSQHRGRRGGRRRGGGGGGGNSARARAYDDADEVYDDDFESDDDVDEEGAERLLTEADGAEDEVGGARDDACVQAMAAFVIESREWALCVQGFLLEHCRRFESTDENRLEWWDLHSQLSRMMESLLEAELSKLGVGVDDFVERLRAADSRAASDLLETVLAMDDFEAFKRMMLQLKGDLDGSGLPQDALDHFASAM